MYFLNLEVIRGFTKYSIAPPLGFMIELLAETFNCIGFSSLFRVSGLAD